MKCLTELSTFSGDDANEESAEVCQTTPQRSERGHMIIWQNPSPSVPSPALWQRSPPSAALLEWDKDGTDMNCTPAKLETAVETVLPWTWMNQCLSVAAMKVSSMIRAVSSSFTSFIFYIHSSFFWLDYPDGCWCLTVCSVKLLFTFALTTHSVSLT